MPRSWRIFLIVLPFAWVTFSTASREMRLAEEVVVGEAVPIHNGHDDVHGLVDAGEEHTSKFHSGVSVLLFCVV